MFLWLEITSLPFIAKFSSDRLPALTYSVSSHCFALSVSTASSQPFAGAFTLSLRAYLTYGASLTHGLRLH